jgi:hypothetical protein
VLLLGALTSVQSLNVPANGEFFFFDSNNKCWFCDPGFHCEPCPPGIRPSLDWATWDPTCPTPSNDDCLANPTLRFPSPDFRYENYYDDDDDDDDGDDDDDDDDEIDT